MAGFLSLGVTDSQALRGFAPAPDGLFPDHLPSIWWGQYHSRAKAEGPLFLTPTFRAEKMFPWARGARHCLSCGAGSGAGVPACGYLSICKDRVPHINHLSNLLHFKAMGKTPMVPQAPKTTHLHSNSLCISFFPCVSITSETVL